MPTTVSCCHRPPKEVGGTAYPSVSSGSHSSLLLVPGLERLPWELCLPCCPLTPSWSPGRGDLHALKTLLGSHTASLPILATTPESEGAHPRLFGGSAGNWTEHLQRTGKYLATELHSFQGRLSILPPAPTAPDFLAYPVPSPTQPYS